MKSIDASPSRRGRLSASAPVCDAREVQNKKTHRSWRCLIFVSIGSMTWGARKVRVRM